MLTKQIPLPVLNFVACNSIVRLCSGSCGGSGNGRRFSDARVGILQGSKGIHYKGLVCGLQNTFSGWLQMASGTAVTIHTSNIPRNVLENLVWMAVKRTKQLWLFRRYTDSEEKIEFSIHYRSSMKKQAIAVIYVCNSKYERNKMRVLKCIPRQTNLTLKQNLSKK